MVVQYNNYGKSSITVKDTQHTMSEHYISYPNWFYTIWGLNLYDFSWQRFVVTREMTCWNVSDWVQITTCITIDIKLTKTE
jgi:hypothetical protein